MVGSVLPPSDVLLFSPPQIGKYLDFTRQACEEDRNNRAGVAAAAATATPPSTRAAAAVGVVAEEDAFFDAEEEQIPPSATASAEGMLVSYEAMGRDEAALRCLLQIHASCSETTSLMRLVQQSMQRMADDIGAIRAAVVTSSAAAAPRGSTVSAAGTTGNGVISGEHSRGAGYTWAYVLCLGLAGASAASVVYLRAKHRSSITA